jgi:transcriptional regulator with XRE-family HTH domain
MDRVYAMNLAMIRKAAQMTQVEVARKLGVGQGAARRLERRDDMLLSTLPWARPDRLWQRAIACRPRGTFRGTALWMIPAQRVQSVR